MSGSQPHLCMSLTEDGQFHLWKDHQKPQKHNVLQAVVLMLFNDVDSLSLADMRDASGIEDKELRRTLQSLACGKIRVLNKEPKVIYPSAPLECSFALLKLWQDQSLVKGT